MADKTFQILGTSTPPMIGRDVVMRRLWSDLAKRTPSHLSIIGPRYAGKTVVMESLKTRMSQEDSPYDAVIYWDLGHQTPNSNEDFINQLCIHIGKELTSNHPDYAKLLLEGLDDAYNNLREVLEVCADEEVKILMLWDGFDKPLSNDVLTRNLWDQLRELASTPSLRLVTASRRPLNELIRSEESATSDFWNIFDMNPIRVGLFDENDIKAVFNRMQNKTFDDSATKELLNWSGGFPPLFLEMINQITSVEDININNEAINSIAADSLNNLKAIIEMLWNDCNEPAKDFYRLLIDHGDQSKSKIGNSDLAFIETRGFVHQVAGNKIRAGCKLLEGYVQTLGKEKGSLANLFADKEEYTSNIKGVLELHLEHVESIDPILKRSIQHSISDIPEFPETCITNVRNIVDKSLDLIWHKEFSGKKIPDDLIHYWGIMGESMPDNWAAQFPDRRGHQVRLLQLLTGTAKSALKAKHVTKNTSVLINSLQGIGDFGQHLDGAHVHLGIAISAVTLSIELAEILSKEL